MAEIRRETRLKSRAPDTVRRRLLLTVMLSAGSLLSVPVAAKEERPKVASVDDRRTLSLYAQCILNRHRSVIIEYVGTAGFSESSDPKRAKSLSDTYCLQSANLAASEMKIGAVTFTYALASAIFRETFAQRPPLDVANIPALSQPTYPDPRTRDVAIAAASSEARRQKIVADFDALSGTVLQMRLGECVVRQDVAGAQALLNAEERSPNERVRLDALVPALSVCLTGLDTVRFNRTMLRGAIGLAYARLGLLQIRAASSGGAS